MNSDEPSANLPPRGERRSAFVAVGQLREHVTETAAAELTREPVGRCWIYRCVGSPTIGRRRNIRVDRVEGGFLVYYGTIQELRNIEPQILD